MTPKTGSWSNCYLKKYLVYKITFLNNTRILSSYVGVYNQNKDRKWHKYISKHEVMKIQADKEVRSPEIERACSFSHCYIILCYEVCGCVKIYRYIISASVNYNSFMISETILMSWRTLSLSGTILHKDNPHVTSLIITEHETHDGRWSELRSLRRRRRYGRRSLLAVHVSRLKRTKGKDPDTRT